MGVSIYIETPKGKEIDITPGGRSAFHSLLDDERLYGILDGRNLKKVVDVAAREVGDFRESLISIAYHITKYKTITVESRW